jgi:hypothetical protein
MYFLIRYIFGFFSSGKKWRWAELYSIDGNAGGMQWRYGRGIEALYYKQHYLHWCARMKKTPLGPVIRFQIIPHGQTHLVK